MVYVRAQIYDRLPSGQLRIGIMANNADGMHFYTDEKCIIRPEMIEEEVNQWIPVAERMPDERQSLIPGLGAFSDPVLVTWVDPTSAKGYPNDRFVRESRTHNGEFTINHINGDLIAVAWKPLPAPAKGDATP